MRTRVTYNAPCMQVQEQRILFVLGRWRRHDIMRALYELFRLVWRRGRRQKSRPSATLSMLVGDGDRSVLLEGVGATENKRSPKCVGDRFLGELV